MVERGLEVHNPLGMLMCFGSNCLPMFKSGRGGLVERGAPRWCLIELCVVNMHHEGVRLRNVSCGKWVRTGVDGVKEVVKWCLVTL